MLLLGQGGSGQPNRLNRFTLYAEIWMNSDSSGSQAVLGSLPGGIWWSVDDGHRLQFSRTNEALMAYSSANVIVQGARNTLSVSWDGASVVFVVNGRPAGSGTSGSSFSAVQQYLGGLNSGYNAYGVPKDGFAIRRLVFIDEALSSTAQLALHAQAHRLFASPRRPSFYSLSGGAPLSGPIRSFLMRRSGLSRIWR